VNTVVTALEKIGNWPTGQLLFALTLAGVLTMAILQTLKDLTPVRRWFQRYWINAWLRERAASFNAKKGDLPQVAADDGRSTLIELSTGGAEDAFYDLQTEQLVAQMNAAAQLALDYPSVDHYYPLLCMVSEGVDVADVVLVHSVPSARAAVAADGTLPAGYTDARTRISHRIQRNLDGVQIAMSDRWQWWLQLASIVLSTTLIEIAIFSEQPSGTATTAQNVFPLFAVGLVVGIAGGYLAPVTRDLVAALQNLRKP
jgi:hypothetical protein